jgi:outer membrane immunogenic protein
MLTKTTSTYKKNTAFPYSCAIYRLVVKPIKTNDGIKENLMRKLIHGCFVLALVLMVSTSADCKELTTYMSCNAGVALLQDADLTDSTMSGAKFNIEYDPGYFVGIAIGSHIDKIRIEGEIGYQKNKLDSMSVTSNGVTYSGDIASDSEIRLTTLMFNIYYDFLKESKFSPYLCAGLGLGNIKVDGTSESDAVGAYQYGAGLAYRISDRVALDFKVRHLETTDAEFDTSNLDFATNNAIFDVRVYF